MKDINLIPEEAKTNTVIKADDEKKSLSVKSVLLAVIILAVAAAGIISPKLYVKTLEIRAESVRDELAGEKYAEVKKVNDQITAAQDEISSKKTVIENISQSTVRISELLDYVTKSAPVGLSVNSMQHANGKLTIRGFSKDSTAVAEYMANLTMVDLLTGYTSSARFNYQKANANLEYTLEFTNKSTKAK